VTPSSMTQASNVVDLAPRTSGASPVEAAIPPDAQLLGVIQLPGSGAAMAIVAHIIPAHQETGSPEKVRDRLVVDRESRLVWSDGAQIDLTYLEFELLAQLAAAPGRVFTRTQLLDATWGGGPETATRTIDVHIHRLRRKLGPPGRQLVTVRRVGYKYEPHIR
jgi:DNA-binding response OmpR family regulator